MSSLEISQMMQRLKGTQPEKHKVTTPGDFEMQNMSATSYQSKQNMMF